MLNRIAPIVAAASVVMTTTAYSQSLDIGAKAPPLGDHVTWIKGEPVPTYKQGQIYILDFWATWCGPCIASMPHMAQVADKYREKGVNVLGIAVWPRDGTASVPDFVKQQGAKITYSIAEDVDAAISTQYLTATDSHSIPTVMIVDRDGLLAWIGHPLEGMDDVLEKILAGKWDGKRVGELNKKGEALITKANALAEKGDWDGAFTLIDEVIDLDHELFGHFGVSKYQVMHARLGRVEDAKVYGQKLVKQMINNDANLLNELSFFIVDAPIQAKDLDLAQQAAEQAVKLTKEAEPAILDTLAAVLAAKGEYQDAVKYQKKAVFLAKDEEDKKEFDARLKTYEAKLKG